MRTFMRLLSLIIVFGIIFIIGCAPQIPEEDYNKGLKALEERNLISAVSFFLQFVEKHPDHAKVPEALLQVSICHAKLGDLDLAREELISLIAKYPSDPSALVAYNHLAAVYRQQENWEAAISTLEQLKKKVTEPADETKILIDIAGIYVQNASWEQALSKYEEVLDDENTPEVVIPDIKLYTARTLGRMERLEDSQKVYEDLIESVTKSDIGLQAQVELAFTVKESSPEYFQNLIDDTLASYQEVVETTGVSSSEKFWAYGKMGEVYYQLKDFPNALKVFELVRENNMKSPRIYGLATHYIESIKAVSPELFPESVVERVKDVTEAEKSDDL